MDFHVSFIRKYERQWFMLLVVFSLLFVFLNATFGLGWKFAAGYSYLLFVFFAFWAYVKKDDLLFRKVIIFSITAGFTELISDWWLVSEMESLVYNPHEPILVNSPLYMPFSWAVVFIQVGYLGWLIGRGKSLIKIMAITTFIGLLFIPMFEHFAKEANWWYYQNCRMIGNVPYYIIFSEAAVSALLPVFFTLMLKRKSFYDAVFYGVIQGLWIWISCMVGFYLFK